MQSWRLSAIYAHTAVAFPPDFISVTTPDCAVHRFTVDKRSWTNNYVPLLVPELSG